MKRHKPIPSEPIKEGDFVALKTGEGPVCYVTSSWTDTRPGAFNRGQQWLGLTYYNSRSGEIVRASHIADAFNQI